MISLILALTVFRSTPVVAVDDDPVVKSFAFFGCNRVDADAWNAKENPSSANLEQLRQNWTDIENISPRPAMLFALGDLVIGYGDDQGEGVRAQLDAWAAEWKKHPLSQKTKLIVVAGNHELNLKRNKEKLPSLHTTAVWNDWLTREGFEPATGNGPTPATDPEDKLVDDQSRLNYSFDVDKLHFIVLNSDTRTEAGIVACIPAYWAAKDFQAAANRGQTTFFLSHRNLIDPASATGDAPIEPRSKGVLLEAIAKTRGFGGFLCAHVHAWDVSAFATGGRQFIAGHGGSPLEKSWKPADGPVFGFAVLEVRKSGKLDVVPYFRSATGAVVPAQPAAPIPVEPPR
ncbi:MAG: metallophosphoesterase [Armatimonadetes bacterium]|nr:metallophosphoesterase [Armatimonadota bacterium]